MADFIHYSLKLNAAIESTEFTIVIVYSDVHENKDGIVITEKVSEEAGGGATTYYKDSAFINVTISPKGNTESKTKIKFVTKKGAKYSKNETPAEILIHELVGHAIPFLEKWRGNAVDRENDVRDQLKLDLREKEPEHESF